MIHFPLNFQMLLIILTHFLFVFCRLVDFVVVVENAVFLANDSVVLSENNEHLSGGISKWDI